MNLIIKNFLFIFYSLVLFNVSIYINGENYYKCSDKYGEISNNPYVEFGFYNNEKETLDTKNHFGGMPILKNETNHGNEKLLKLLSMPSNSTINVVTIDEIKLKDNFEGSQKLWIFFCNIDNSKLYYPFGRSNNTEILNYTKRPVRCSLLQCNLGYFYYEQMSDQNGENSNKNIATSRDIIYIGIKTSDINRNLIFSTFKFEGGGFNLIPCPYTDWFHHQNIMKFYPNEYVTKNGIIMDNDLNRHALVLGIPTPGFDDILFCGHIHQHIYSNISVGLKIKETSQYTNYKKIKFEKDMNVSCDGNLVELEQMHIYTPPNTFYYSNPKMGYKINPKSYHVHSGQIIIAFRKDKLRKMNAYEYDDEGDVEYMDKRISISPECVGKIDDIPASFKFKIDNETLDHQISSNGINFIKIDLSKFKQKVPVSCEVVMSTDDKRFKEFYKLKYEFVLTKLTVNGFLLKITDNIKYLDPTTQNNYGHYTCKIKPRHINRNIKKLNFHLVPMNKTTVYEDIDITPENLNKMCCLKIYMGIGNINQLEVKLNNGTILTSANSPYSFTELRNYIVLKKIDKENINSTVITCRYNFNGEQFMDIVKTLHFNDNPNNNNLSIPK